MKERIAEALKQSMKARDTLRTGALRMVLAEIKMLETSGQKDVDPAQAVATYAKRLDKSIAEYTSLGQPEQVEKLKAERAVVAEFLPQQLTADQTEAIVDGVLADNPEFTARDMGKVMKIVMADHKGQVDGKLVQELTKNKLAQR